MPYKKSYTLKNAFPFLKHPGRYTGKLPITLRSGLEINFVFKFLDKHPSVLEWTNESIIIPYFDTTLNKNRRYFPDFWMKIKDKNNKIEEYLIEIKPKKFLKEWNKKINKKNIREFMEYARNKDKWKAALTFCKERNWKFLIVTEDLIPDK